MKQFKLEEKNLESLYERATVLLRELRLQNLKHIHLADLLISVWSEAVMLFSFMPWKASEASLCILNLCWKAEPPLFFNQLAILAWFHFVNHVENFMERKGVEKRTKWCSKYLKVDNLFFSFLPDSQKLIFSASFISVPEQIPPARSFWAAGILLEESHTETPLAGKC